MFHMLVATICLQPTLTGGQDQRDPERTPPIAISGDAEIASIKIVRCKSTDAAIEADLTNMEMELWLTSEFDGKTRRRFLVNLLDLGPIQDDTGKLLSSEKRLKWLPFLHSDFIADSYKASRGKGGPLIRFLLDAPAKQANKIKSIKGKAVVSEWKLARLEFDLSFKKGKRFDDPNLKELKIEPAIKVEKGETIVSLRVPDRHARLVEWGLARGNQLLRFMSLSSKDGGNGRLLLEKTYRIDSNMASALVIVIAEPIAPKELEFNFSNVELP